MKEIYFNFFLRLVGFLAVCQWFLEAGTVAPGSGLFDFCSWSILYSRWMMGDGAVQGMVSMILAAHAGWEEYPGNAKRRGPSRPHR